jgi:CxxC-x17-CxxC domain-containing protein
MLYCLMRDFRRPSGGRDFKRRDFDRPQIMHQAICSNCGKECEVPFKPTGSKPVFCRECFQNNRTDDTRRQDNFPPRRPNFDDRNSFQPNRPPAPRDPHREQFENLNAKLDKILSILATKETAKPAIGKVPVVQPVEIAVPEPMPDVDVEAVAETQAAAEVRMKTPISKKKKVVKKSSEEK